MLHDERGAKQTTNHDWTDSTVSNVTFSDPSFKVAAKSETNSNMESIFHMLGLFVDIMKVDLLASQKISKCHFLKDIENFFHEVTHIDLEPLEVSFYYTD